MKYAHSAWKEERLSWRSVIQLNIIRSIVTIVEIMQGEMAGGLPAVSLSDGDDDTEKEVTVDDGPPIHFTDKHHLLKLRLGPLRRVEEDLKRRLGAGCEELQATDAPMRATPFDTDFVPDLSPTRRPREFVVRCWKDAFRSQPRRSPSSERTSGKERSEVDEATGVIAGCKDYMKALWDDSTVQSMLRRRNIRLQDTAGL
jgi:hypothetical protein